MRKVLVIGCGGSGKSTLARRIAQRIGLPTIHLDSFYWQSGWIPAENAVWKRTVDDLLNRPAWIMDGNYSGTMPQRIAACDTAIFLDFPTVVCLWRIVKRRILFAGKSRPDMAEGCSERLTWEFVRFVIAYRATRRPRILRQLAAAEATRIIILRNQAAVERFALNLQPDGQLEP